jgi:uncharacterized protein YdeI (YjbR/CyaY-like superfamily)
MSDASAEVDAYIANAAEFAQPILKKIRKLFHQSCPDVQETIKWSFPHFEYKGLLGSMAAFKQHVSFGFWKGQLMSDPKKLFQGVGNTSMTGVRVTSLADLPDDKTMLEYIREAMRLNEQGVKPPKPAKKAKPAELQVPKDLAAALSKNKAARATFEAFSPSHKREYIEWIEEAKQVATRHKRLATTIEWLSEGKSRH